MSALEIAPFAPALLASLRGVGYLPEAAVADLVDNAISAGATTVEVMFAWNNGRPEVTIADDGCGMDRATLIEAMRIGGRGPDAARADGDLGRFGLGLKTASLSQARCLTVATAKGGSAYCLRLDLDHIERREGRWEILELEPLCLGTPWGAVAQRGHGTVVGWSAPDAASGLDTVDEDAFLTNVERVERHLGMVFHRFIEGDARRLRLIINGRPVKAWDPFLEAHPATIAKPEERFQAPGGLVRVRGFVLPHKDRFRNPEEFEAAGGFAGWSAQQGFYVYRGRRLVVAGGWLGLGGSRAWTRDEASRLARIRIDMAPSGDAAWRIDVRKSTARPPAVLRAKLQRLAADVRQHAREVFAWRGGQGTSRAVAAPERIWETRETLRGKRYAVRRDHPLTVALMDALGDRRNLLDRWLAAVEWSVPVERIWLDVADAGGPSEPTPSADEIPHLVGAVVAVVRSLPEVQSLDRSIDQALRLVPQPVARAIRAEVERQFRGDQR